MECLVSPSLSPARPAPLVLYLSMVAVGMGQTVVFAILPMLGRELGLQELVLPLPGGGGWQPRELAITAMSALTALTFSLVAPFWGRRADQWGRRRIMMLGMVGYSVGTLLFNGVAWLGLAGLLGGGLLYGLLVLMRVVHASVMSATHPAASAYMVDITSVAQRTRGMGKLAAANQIGVMLGPALAWFAFISLLAPLYIQAAMTLLVGLVIVWLLPESRSQQGQQEPGARLSYLDPRFRHFLFIGLLLYTMMGMAQQTLGFYFQDRLGLDRVAAAQRLSLAMMVSSAAMLLSQLGVVQRLGWGPISLLRAGVPLTMVGYGLMAAAATEQQLWLAMALFGLGMGMSAPGFAASSTLTVQTSEQGALAGLTGAVAGFGFLLGPLLGGYVYRFDPSFPYWLAAVLMLPLAIALWWLKPLVVSADSPAEQRRR